MKRLAISTLKQARRVIVFVIGGTVLLVGLAMVVLPGPATIVVPVGLGILALEFAWARRMLKRIKQAAEGVRNYASAKLGGQGRGPATASSDRDAPRA